MSIEEGKVDCVNLNDETELQKYRFEETIGQGNFGKVKLATYTPTKEQFAVKILNKAQIQLKNEMTLVQRELNIIKHFNHINVIYVHRIIEDAENYYIVMDYCEKGELFDFIVHKKHLEEDEAAVLFFQLMNGVEYIHSKHIVHRDLKPENLLITRTSTLKIIDFGLSSYFGGDRLLSTKCGSPSYAAPEIITGIQYNGCQTDVWCCGIILYAMVCGYLPFDGIDNKELFRNIVEGNFDFPEFISLCAEGMIREMLNPNANHRVTVEEIKQRPFYLKGKDIWDSQMLKKHKVAGLRLLNSHSEVSSFKKSIHSINTKFNSPHAVPLSAKIEEILKTDATLLYHSLKTKANANAKDKGQEQDQRKVNSIKVTNDLLPRELKRMLLKKFNQMNPLRKILEKRLNHNEQTTHNLLIQKTKQSKKPQITVESNIYPIVPKNKRMNSQTTLQRGLSTKMNTKCLPTEPKEFQECLKRNFTKYIKNNTKSNFTATSQSKITQYPRAKSKEDRLLMTKRGHKLLKLTHYY